MTIDFVEVNGWMYEVVGHNGPILRDGEELDFYADAVSRQILYDKHLPTPAAVAAVARAVCMAWQDRANPRPIRFAGAVS